MRRGGFHMEAFASRPLRFGFDARRELALGLGLFLCLWVALATILPETMTVGAGSSGAYARASQALARLPLSFEANQGQADAHVSFLARTPGATLYLAAREAVLSLTRTGPASQPSALRMQLVGASDGAQPIGMDLLPGRSNYFIGDDPAQWRTDIPSYGQGSAQRCASAWISPTTATASSWSTTSPRRGRLAEPDCARLPERREHEPGS